MYLTRISSATNYSRQRLSGDARQIDLRSHKGFCHCSKHTGAKAGKTVVPNKDQFFNYVLLIFILISGVNL